MEKWFDNKNGRWQRCLCRSFGANRLFDLNKPKVTITKKIFQTDILDFEYILDCVSEPQLFFNPTKPFS